jgi:hypothetical protein
MPIVGARRAPNPPILDNWTSELPSPDDAHWIGARGADKEDQAASDFGRSGRSWREADVKNTDLETVILNILAGQYKTPSASSPSIL